MAERDLTRNLMLVCRLLRRAYNPDAGGAGELAVETGAALLPTHCWFEGRGYSVRIRRWIVPAVTSLPSHRRWPTARAEHCRPSPRIAAALWLADDPNRGGRKSEVQMRSMRDRHDLSVLVRRPGGAVAMCYACRGDGAPAATFGRVCARCRLPHAALPDYFAPGGRAVRFSHGSGGPAVFGPATHRKASKCGLRMVISTYRIYTMNAPSLPMLALWNIAEGPITFHTSITVADADGVPGHCGPCTRRSSRPDRGVRPSPALADGGVGIRCGGDPQWGWTLTPFASAARPDGYRAKTVLRSGPLRRLASAAALRSTRRRWCSGFRMSITDRRPTSCAARRAVWRHLRFLPGWTTPQCFGDAQRRRLRAPNTR